MPDGAQVLPVVQLKYGTADAEHKLIFRRKSMIKKILMLLLIIPALFLAGVLGLYLNGACRYKNHVADEALSSWMMYIPDETLIKEIAIPGSHDAGTEGMPWPFRTQNYSIGKQLTFGARYFDIRVNKTEKGYPIFHSSMNGVDFRDVLAQIKEFIKAHPSEVLMLDFQHFKGDSQSDVYEFLSNELDKENLIVHNKTDKNDVEFIGSLTLGEARGKCIIFYGGTENDFSDWVFLRNNDERTKDNMTLDSYYLGKLHRGGHEVLVKEAHPVYFEHLAKKQQENKDGIFVLQCQLTDGKGIFGPWSLERGQERKMGEYVRNLKDSPNLKSINVVMRDFLIPEKCQDIVDLNIAKGLMEKPES